MSYMPDTFIPSFVAQEKDEKSSVGQLTVVQQLKKL